MGKREKTEGRKNWREGKINEWSRERNDQGNEEEGKKKNYSYIKEILIKENPTEAVEKRVNIKIEGKWIKDDKRLLKIEENR